MIWPLPDDADLPGDRRLGGPWTTAGSGADPHSADEGYDTDAAARTVPAGWDAIQLTAEEAVAFARIVQDLSAEEPVAARMVPARRMAALAAAALVWMLLSVLMVALGWAGVLITVVVSAGTATVVALHLRHRAGSS
ncbi:hypothetical protein [Dactylosporangium aurantiacum]|nr:hypothetical protein [Dactylosporangium aurantiacum]MDG6110341.1 hypothetical protein [Dactylosporangium aurantiacum]